MKKFEEQKFDIPKLKGISEKTIEEHLKLYSGYVKNSNQVLEKIEELRKDAEANMGLISGLERRFSFEFNGMRNHEIYFKSFENGSKTLENESKLKMKIEEEWGSFEEWLSFFKTLATTRGVGWAILYYDKKTDRLLNGWVDEQHLGHLNGLSPIIMLDMWEHSFVADYQPSGKTQYIEDFFANVNWDFFEKNFSEALQ